MTKSNNEWVPEVGQEFSYGCWSWGEKYRSGECGVWGKLKAISDDYLIVENADGKEHPLHREGLMMSPIKTEAEKRRESQLEMIRSKLDAALDVDDVMAAILYKAGIRVLSDNQFMATKPSIDQIQAELYKAEQEGRSMTWIDGLHAGLIKAAHIMGGDS